VKKLLVVGATGMLGHELITTAKRDPLFDTWCTVRDNAALQWVPREFHAQTLLCDVREQQQIERTVKLGFEVIINCAGLTKALATNHRLAIEVNSYAPHVLASCATSIGARLIHISTDCVFSGRVGKYRVDDIADPIDLYGRSKLLGEVDYNQHLSIRTSFIGPELHTQHGLFEWFMAQHGDISGYSNVYWSGFTTPALSRILLALSLRDKAAGLMHVAGERLSKFELLRKLKTVFCRNDVTIHACDHPEIDRSLDNSQFLIHGIGVPSMDSMLRDLANDQGIAH
jgi:dTDP-4-dehydrorhamnose reductase